MNDLGAVLKIDVQVQRGQVQRSSVLGSNTCAPFPPLPDRENIHQEFKGCAIMILRQTDCVNEL